MALDRVRRQMHNMSALTENIGGIKESISESKQSLGEKYDGFEGDVSSLMAEVKKNISDTHTRMVQQLELKQRSK